LLYFLCLAVVSSTPAPTLEQTLVLGRERDAPWKEFTRRGGELRGVGLTSGLRGSRDIVLSDDEHAPGSGTDLLIHFNDSPFRDQSGLYRVEQGDVLLSNREAVMGRGAAAFTPQTGPITVHPRAGSLFSAGWRDFTLEFWLYPVNLIDGEEILAWSSSVTRGDAGRLSGGDPARHGVRRGGRHRPAAVHHGSGTASDRAPVLGAHGRAAALVHVGGRAFA